MLGSLSGPFATRNNLAAAITDLAQHGNHLVQPLRLSVSSSSDALIDFEHAVDERHPFNIAVGDSTNTALPIRNLKNASITLNRAEKYRARITTSLSVAGRTSFRCD